MKYTITGMFEIKAETKDIRDAKARASKMLNDAGVRHFVIEARKENDEDVEETQKRTTAGETEAAMQS